MLWLDTTVADLNVLDLEKRIDMLSLFVIAHEEGGTHSQLGTLSAVEKYEDRGRLYVALSFSHAGYLFAEGPLTRVQVHTTPVQDRHAEQMNELLDEFREAVTPEPVPFKSRTLRSFFTGKEG